MERKWKRIWRGNVLSRQRWCTTSRRTVKLRSVALIQEKCGLTVTAFGLLCSYWRAHSTCLHTHTHTHTHSFSLAKRGIGGVAAKVPSWDHPGLLLGPASLAACIIQRAPADSCNSIPARPTGVLSYRVSDCVCVCVCVCVRACACKMCVVIRVCAFIRSAVPGRTSPLSMPLCLPCRVTPSTGWGRRGRTPTGLLNTHSPSIASHTHTHTQRTLSTEFIVCRSVRSTRIEKEVGTIWS